MKYISLFSGIEAASVAWMPLEWEAIAFAEIDSFPSQVLAYRFPDVPNLGDVTKVDWSKYRGKCDLIIGGSPCQSFSIAGLRKGLADPRGNLMLEYLRACEAVSPEWIIWENVPGVLSADGRRAFQTFIEAVVELWPRGGCAWRVLDAQFFGVAQRRRRVFVVINTRDWRRAPAVLFEPGSLCGHNPSSREKREELTRTARICVESDCEPGCLTPWDNESKRIFSHDGTAPTLYSATTSGQQQLAVLTPWDVQSKRVYSSEGIAPGLQSGTNEGMNIQPIVMTEANSEAEAVCIQGSMIGRSDKNGPQGDGLNEDVSFTLNTTDRHAVAYECIGDSSAVAFAQNSRDELRIVGGDGSYVGALAASPGMKQQCYIMEQAEESGVICMSDTQSNTSIGEIPSITAHSQKDAPVICIADDNTNAAIDKDLCGSLKVGGGYP